MSAAAVVTATHEPLPHRQGRKGWKTTYEGAVRPHPRFELQLNEQGIATVHNADLAVIRLDEPVEKNIPPVRLAETAAKVGEFLTAVGYGYIDESAALLGERFFSRERVQELLEPNGRLVVFGSPESHSYKGDTGGPCLRETAERLELLGISNRGLGQQPTFTSTSPYRDWLAEEIRLAGLPPPDPQGPEDQKAPTP